MVAALAEHCRLKFPPTQPHSITLTTKHSRLVCSSFTCHIQLLVTTTRLELGSCCNLALQTSIRVFNWITDSIDCDYSNWKSIKYTILSIFICKCKIMKKVFLRRIICTNSIYYAESWVKDMLCGFLSCWTSNWFMLVIV